MSTPMLPPPTASEKAFCGQKKARQAQKAAADFTAHAKECTCPKHVKHVESLQKELVELQEAYSTDSDLNSRRLLELAARANQDAATIGTLRDANLTLVQTVGRLRQELAARTESRRTLEDELAAVRAELAVATSDEHMQQLRDEVWDASEGAMMDLVRRFNASQEQSATLENELNEERETWGIKERAWKTKERRFKQFSWFTGLGLLGMVVYLISGQFMGGRNGTSYDTAIAPVGIQTDLAVIEICATDMAIFYCPEGDVAIADPGPPITTDLILLAPPTVAEPNCFWIDSDEWQHNTTGLLTIDGPSEVESGCVCAVPRVSVSNVNTFVAGVTVAAFVGGATYALFVWF